MKYIFALILLFSGLSQNTQDANLIYWSENVKLEWKDFKAPAQNHPTHKAMSSLTLSIAMSGSSDSVIVTSKSTFDRSKSWVRTDSQTPRILEHEQLHFDIRELYTRKLKKTMIEKQFKRKTVQAELNNTFKDINTQYGKAQYEYDQESYTSEEKQRDWKTRIELELKSLSAFEGPVTKIILTN